MKLADHIIAVQRGDIAPRVVEHPSACVAWTPTWEGPARPDYPAAAADLADRLRGIAGPDLVCWEADTYLSAGNESELAAKLKEVHQQKLALWQAIAGCPEPRCRDCADFDGRCQGDGLPCDPQERALERIKRLRAEPQPVAVTEAMVEAGAIGLMRDVAEHDFGPAFSEASEQSKSEAKVMARAVLNAALSLTRPEPSTGR